MLQETNEKEKIIKSKCLADALVWIGFVYRKDSNGNYIFKRTREFDRAFRDMHYLKSLHRKE